MKFSKLKGLAINAGLSLIPAVAALPLVSPILSGAASQQDGASEISAAIDAYSSITTWADAFLDAMASSAGPRSLLMTWGVVTLLVTAAEFSIVQRSGEKTVEDGAFDTLKPYKDRQIRKHMVPWDGATAVESVGVVLGCDRKRGEFLTLPATHAITIAPSGSGKSRGQIYGSIDLLTHGPITCNLIVSDPSLELLALTYDTLVKRGYDVRVLDVDNGWGDRWNPLAEITRLFFQDGDAEGAASRSVDLANVLCACPDEAGPNAWVYREGASVLAAAIYEVATSAAVPDTQRHLCSVCSMVIALATESGAEGLKRHFRESGDDTVLVLASSFLAAEDRQVGAILSTLLDSVMPFTTASMRYLTSASDIDIASMCDVNSKVAVFIRTLEPMNPRMRVASAFVEMHMRALFRAGARRGNARETFFIGDEMASFRINLAYGMQQGRKYGWHAYVVFQDTTESSMGKDRDTILSNCDVKSLFRAGEEGDALMFSGLSGSKTLAVHNVSESSSGQTHTASEGWGEQRTPAWEPARLMHNNASRDGIFVVSTIASRPELCGLFEGVPICDVTQSPMAKSFPGFGTKKHEAKRITAFLDALREESMSRNRSVEAWIPPNAAIAGEPDDEPRPDPDLFLE